MARPRKEGMDYFPHDTDASSDEKVEALRILHGNDGYAFYFILLERIYRTAEFELDVSEAETIQILARKVAVTTEKFESMLETALKYDCFDREAYEERKVLTSNGVKNRSSIVVEKREAMRKKYQKQTKKVSDAETTQETTEETEEETPQSKVKESKEKQSKAKKSKEEGVKENLSSTKDIETYVESRLASNPLSVNKRILIKYIDCLRLTRRTTRIATSVIDRLWSRWERFSPTVVNYAMWLHIEKYDDRREEYTLGIMRSTEEHEANRGLMKLKNKHQPVIIPKSFEPKTKLKSEEVALEPADDVSDEEIQNLLAQMKTGEGGA